MSTSAPLVTVSLEESESVLHSFMTRTTYRVLVERDWIPVVRHPTATVESLSKGPGVVWRRLVELQLPVGSLLERTVEKPRRDGANTVDVLFGRSKGLQRDCQRQRFEVGARGRLFAART